MKKRRIIQSILWTEQPTGVIMGAGSLWLFTLAITIIKCVRTVQNYAEGKEQVLGSS
jgi:hypothetical protein